MDDSGNVILTSSALENGTTVAGVVADKGQVHVPQKSGDNDSGDDNHDKSNDGGGAYECNGVVQTVQKQIRDTGFGPTTEAQQCQLSP
jgi:hypothetical protein